LILPAKGKFPAGAYIISKIEGKGTLALEPEHMPTEPTEEGDETKTTKKVQLRSFGKAEIEKYLREKTLL